MKKITLISVAIGVAALAFFLFEQAPKSAQTAPNQPAKLGYFDYADEAGGLKARVFLPESLGQWAVENPWRDADKSLLKEPKIFVKANFQSIATPSFYGLLRVSYDLQGYDCGGLFAKLAQLDGLSLVKYSDTTVGGIEKGKLYVFQYYQPQKHLVIGSKVLCDSKTAIELMVISPDDKKYGDAINTILKTVEMTIPGSPTQPRIK